MTFAYNDAGLRTSKTVNGVTTEYYYRGSLLMAQKTGDEMLLFHYDENGSPLGFQYRNSTHASGVFEEYIYEKNLQGDIVAIYNNAGTKLLSYRYDAWGNVNISYYNSGSSTGAAKNPLTYRGYYYDTDLAMYYLQSRYYDPAIGRFINADGVDYLGANGDLNSYNLYAYCSNNPVMYTDPSGHSAWAVVIILAIGFVAGGIWGGFQEYRIGDTTGDEEGDSSKLTTGDRIRNVFIGATIGTAGSGLVLILWGAGGSLIVGSAGKALAVLGVSGYQAVAMGALAYNVFPMILAPFFNIELEPLELQ